MTTPRDAIGLSERLREWVTDWDGSQMQDGEPPRDGIHCDIIREAAAALDALQARVKELEAERLQVRGILAGSDYGSLPNDWKLERIADARMNDVHDLRWQVKDTCSRAEAAESRATRAEQERDKALACCDSYANENQQLHDRMEKAQQERDEALKRLKPFADAAESLYESHLDLIDLWESPSGLEITAGHLRAARDLVRRLAAGTEKKGK